MRAGLTQGHNIRTASAVYSMYTVKIMQIYILYA